MLSCNSRGVRTKCGSTPNQHFTEGALRLRNSDQIAVDFFDNTRVWTLKTIVFLKNVHDSEDAGIVIPTQTTIDVHWTFSMK